MRCLLCENEQVLKGKKAKCFICTIVKRRNLPTT